MRLLPFVLITAVGIIACRTTPQKNESSSTPERSSTPFPPVVVPNGVSAGERRPLLVLLHGLGASGEEMAGHTGFVELARNERLFLTAPNGTIDSHGRRFWEATDSCCNFEKRTVDHVGYLRELIENATRTHAVDPQRVFVIGFSNGGFMAHRLACELSTLISGVVSISGAGPNPGTRCAPDRPVNVLEIHADADPVVTYAGGRLFGKPDYPTHIGAEQTVREWAERNACSSSPDTGASLDLQSSIAGNETRVTRFKDCKRGRVELWTVVDGGHNVAMRDPAPAAIWKFLNGA